MNIRLYNMFHNMPTSNFALFNELLEGFKKAKPDEEIIIDLNTEGVDLDNSKISELIEIIADIFNKPYNLISIRNGNLVKSSTPFKEITVQQGSFAKWCQVIPDVQKEIDHKFCMFIRGSTYYRLALSAWLNCNSNSVYQSFNSAKEKLKGEIFELASSNNKDLIDNINEFMLKLPVQLDDLNGNPKYIASSQTSWNLLVPYYQRSFIEIVAETAFNGNVFFPTEKTFRPIALKTPFILFGPKHYLQRLRSLGFKTFEPWFNESYDNYSDHKRIAKMIEVLEYIEGLPMQRILEMQSEMKSTLAHNRALLLDEKFIREYSDTTFNS